MSNSFENHVSLFSVSESALLSRINRKLKRQDSELQIRKLSPRSRWWNDCGDYYAVDVYRNWVVETWCNLEEWGRDLGVLKRHERLNQN